MKAINIAAALGFVVLSVSACERRDNTDTQRSAQSTPANPAPPANPGPQQPTLGESTEERMRQTGNDIDRAADKTSDRIAGHDAGHLNPGRDDNNPTRRSGLAAGAPGSREWARDRMAKVRCDHYAACGEVAKGKKYDTVDSCVVRERASLDKDWSLDDCAKVDTIRLDTCMSDVKAKKCDTFWTSFPDSCDTSKVCIERN